MTFSFRLKIPGCISSLFLAGIVRMLIKVTIDGWCDVEIKKYELLSSIHGHLESIESSPGFFHIPSNCTKNDSEGMILPWNFHPGNTEVGKSTGARFWPHRNLNLCPSHTSGIWTSALKLIARFSSTIPEILRDDCEGFVKDKMPNKLLVKRTWGLQHVT